MLTKILPQNKMVTKAFGISILATAILGSSLLLPTTAEAHCDNVNGPVVKAAKQALETKNVNLILPYVSKDSEKELQEAFKQSLTVRKEGREAKELADYSFFETAVRLHRAGEGAPYTGLKPAEIDYGPALPAAEKALESGSPSEVKHLMAELVSQAVDQKFEQTMNIKAKATGNSVEAERERVEADLQFQIFVHEIYEKMQVTPEGQHNHDSEGGAKSVVNAGHNH